MNKIIAILLALLLSVSTCQKKANKVIVDHTMVATEDTLTRHQLDSVFRVEELSLDIENDWISSPVVSEDKKEYLYKYVFIKELTDSTGTVFTLCSYQDTLYILNKRVVE